MKINLAPLVVPTVDPNGFYKRKDKTIPSTSELNPPD